MSAAGVCRVQAAANVVDESVSLLARAARRSYKVISLVGVVALVAGLSAPVAATPQPAPSGGARPGTPMTRQQLVDHVNRASEELEKVVERYNQLRDDLRTTVTQIGVLKRQLVPLQKKVDLHRAKVGMIASAAYTTAGSTGLNALLHADDTRDVLDQLMVIQLLADDQRREITTLTRLRDQYEAAQATLRALVIQGKDQQKELAASRAKIEGDLAELQRLRDRAFGPGREPHRLNARQGWTKPEVSGKPRKILDFALNQLGKAYRWAGEGPDGYDCSGLVLAAYKLIGKELPHNSARQFDVARKIKRADLTPGDLIFFYRDLHHVGIYVGGDRMIHAPNAGERIRIDLIDALPIRGFGRVL
ncbi:MAG: hypothetical protein HOV79_05770 [Hamadaea sp.]|nr:hypothetical protein [Hamadaea sp.]